MGCPIGQGNSIFGPADKYIKFLGGDVVAIEGANLVDKQILNDLRIPYSQLLRGRIVLKAGQVNYLMNHLGLGDNATFLSISARYNSKSVVEEDNYVKYNYYPNLSNNYYFNQVLILTGNSTHRIPQLYLTNPNPDYNVTLDVLVANIDDTYEYFSDVINQSGLTFTGLRSGDIQTHVPGDSLVVYDLDNEPLGYISISTISSIERTGVIITIQESTVGKLFLEFIDEANAKQAYSLLNYVVNNDGAIIDNTYNDSQSPIVYFNGTASGYAISMIGATTSGPYNTSMGISFSATMSLSDVLNETYLRTDLIDILVNTVVDNKDNIMSLDASNVTITNPNSVTVSSIYLSGTYSVTFNVMDYAGNVVDPLTNVRLNIIA